MPEPMSDERYERLMAVASGKRGVMPAQCRGLIREAMAEVCRLRAAAGVEVPEPQAEPIPLTDDPHVFVPFGVEYSEPHRCVVCLADEDGGFHVPAAGDHEDPPAAAPEWSVGDWFTIDPKRCMTFDGLRSERRGTTGKTPGATYQVTALPKGGVHFIDDAGEPHYLGFASISKVAAGGATEEETP